MTQRHFIMLAAMLARTKQRQADNLKAESQKARARGDDATADQLWEQAVELEIWYKSIWGDGGEVDQRQRARARGDVCSYCGESHPEHGDICPVYERHKLED